MEIYWTTNTEETQRELAARSDIPCADMKFGRSSFGLPGKFIIIKPNGLYWSSTPEGCVNDGYRSRTPEEFVSIAAERWPKTWKNTELELLNKLDDIVDKLKRLIQK